jgi:two-component system, chemotaxis family, protein-glutamate methylesterase/glutaminase
MKSPASSPRELRVLVVDDCQTLRRFALRSLESAGHRVCGLADSGRGVARAAARCLPDVVVLDIQMPDVDGLAATRELMASFPRPVVIFCGVSDAASQRLAFQALEAGAVSLVPKPGATQALEACAAELVRAVEVAAGVRIITRHERGEPLPAPPPQVAPHDRRDRPALVAIGASTGGPLAVRDVVLGLGQLAAPVLVVQHIVPGFLETFAAWLATQTPRPVVVGRSGVTPSRGTVYLAPTSGHLTLRRGLLHVEDGPPVRGHRPSIDVLFESVARELGGSAAGALLTGMGEDGARGLLAMRSAGAMTVAQDEATSAVFGMPRVARELGAAGRTLPLWAIGPAIAGRP